MICCESSACPTPQSDTVSAGSATVMKRRRTRRGFTLLEVLIATAVTLLMMISLAQIFKVIGDSMQQGRSVLELNNRLRSVVYRLRSDLDNLTAIPNPPADPSTGLGYLQVIDGSTTDFTAATKLSTAASRFGDVDDILMATVRAGDVWFTGKVPRYLTFNPPRPSVPTQQTDFELVSIASQHAEIAVFLQPLVTNELNPNRDPGFFLTSAAKERSFEDTDPFTGFPDSFRLYYRTLLIRPDLNLNGVLASAVDNAGVHWLHAVPLEDAQARIGSIPGLASPIPGTPSPMCDMAIPHQQCDLSIRRIYNPASGSLDLVAANSLEDLADPANRFAHVQVPIPSTAGSTTMPVLALGAKLAVNVSDPGTLQVGSGFLHPAFVLLGNRAGEDLLASNILAFDIKLFDPEVPLLAMGDLVLSPNDPGYEAALGSPAVGTGEYVDLAWAKKLVDHSPNPNPNTIFSAATDAWGPLSGFSLANFSSYGVGGAYTDSIFKSGNVLTSRPPTVLIPLLLQPSYDTYTTRYEGDGVLQSQLSSLFGVVRINGAVDLYGVGGSDATNLVSDWRSNPSIIFDAGTDGIDNAGNSLLGIPGSLPGVDDPSELETSPPFPTPLRGLKVSVRMEDPVTRQVKQMSATKEFVSQ